MCQTFYFIYFIFQFKQSLSVTIGFLSIWTLNCTFPKDVNLYALFTATTSGE